MLDLASRSEKHMARVIVHYDIPQSPKDERDGFVASFDDSSWDFDYLTDSVYAVDIELDGDGENITKLKAFLREKSEGLKKHGEVRIFIEKPDREGGKSMPTTVQIRVCDTQECEH
jgi:hypothetical protein